MVIKEVLKNPNVELLNTVMSLLLKIMTVPITEQIGQLAHQLVTEIVLSSPLIQIRSALLHDYLHHTEYSTSIPIFQDSESYSPDHHLFPSVLTRYIQDQSLEAKIEECCCLCASVAACESYQEDLAKSPLIQWCTHQAEQYSENEVIVEATLKCLCRLWESTLFWSVLRNRF